MEQHKSDTVSQLSMGQSAHRLGQAMKITTVKWGRPR